MHKNKHTVEEVGEWLKARKHFSISALETSAHIPPGLLGRHIRGKQRLSEEHLPNLIQILRDYGFK